MKLTLLKHQIWRIIQPHLDARRPSELDIGLPGRHVTQMGFSNLLIGIEKSQVQPVDNLDKMYNKLAIYLYKCIKSGIDSSFVDSKIRGIQGDT